MHFRVESAKSFYSRNLKLFFEEINKHENSNLLLLGYGEHWKLNVLLNTLENVNLFITNSRKEGKEKVLLNRFKTSTKIENISNMIDFKIPEEKGVLLTDLTVLSTKIRDEIQKKVDNDV